MDPAFFEPSGRTSPRQALAAGTQSRKALAQACSTAVERSTGALLAFQKPEGYWCGDLLADATLESDYTLLQLWLHPPQDGLWNPPAAERIRKVRRSILERQLPDGSFNIYPGGPAEVSASVKAYTALKLSGMDAESEPMRRLRQCILDCGGIQAVNSYVKINLSLFGLYPRAYVPTVPPELVLVPGNILYEMSSWTRAIVVPLSIVQAVGGTRPAPQGFHLNELAAPGKSFALPRRYKMSFVFNQIDRALKIWQRHGPREVKRAALRAAEKWMLDRTRYSEGLGAIYPSMMYLIMALESLGYPEDHPDRILATRQFEDLFTETANNFYFQPALSPVWDTACAAFALGETGRAPTDRLEKAAQWLISKEVRHKGDWSVKRPDLAPSGWAFQFANEHYPDIDDTAMALLSLMHAKSADSPRAELAREHAIARRRLGSLRRRQQLGGPQQSPVRRP